MASVRSARLTKDIGCVRPVNKIDLDLPEGGVAEFVGPNGRWPLVVALVRVVGFRAVGSGFLAW